MKLRTWARNTLEVITAVMLLTLFMVNDVSPKGLIILTVLIALCLSNTYLLDNY